VKKPGWKRRDKVRTSSRKTGALKCWWMLCRGLALLVG